MHYEKLIRRFIGLLVPTPILFLGGENQAMTQDKERAAPAKEEVKVLLDNDKVQVVEQRLKLGAASNSRACAYRVVRNLKGGTLQRIYLDGKKETRSWKSGEVKVLSRPRPPVLSKTSVKPSPFFTW